MPGLLVASPDHGLLCAFRGDPSLTGVEVHHAAAQCALLDAHEPPYDLVVLDERLVDTSIAALVPQLVTSRCGILVVSCAPSERNMVLWLDLGADDVIARPYSTPELLARVHAILRRRRRADVGHLRTEGAFSLDPDTRSVVLGERALHVPPLEFAVLQSLGARHGIPVPREVLLVECWSTSTQRRPEYVDAVIRRLRVRLEPRPSEPQHIVTVRSKGYALRP